MKEPFVPVSTISQMLPMSMRHEFFKRVFGRQRLYGYRGIHAIDIVPTSTDIPTWVAYWAKYRNETR